MKKIIMIIAMVMMSSSVMAADNLSSISIWGDTLSTIGGDTISTIGNEQEYDYSQHGTYDYISGVEVPTTDPMRPSSWGCTALGADLGNC